MKIEKRNHKGFTLVELLIAVVILAVVVIPLINNIVLSAKINQKSKKVMNGTSMMQNVMEGMNAYAVEDVVKSFEKHSAVSSNSLTFFPNGMTVSNYGELDTTGTSIQYDQTSLPSASQYGVFDVSGNVVDIKEPVDNKYMLFAQDVKQGKNKFDIRFTIDASAYIKPVSGAVAGMTYYNSESMTNIASLNPLYDCSYAEPGSEFRDMCEEFAKISTNSTPPATFRAALKRTMKVMVTDVGTVMDPDVRVDVINEYTCNSPTTYGITTANKTQSESHIGLFSSAVNDKDPRNIYIYYRGNYESNLGNVLDNIEVTNTSGKPVTVYLVRVNIQDDIFAIRTDDSPNNELNYVVNVRVYDSKAGDANLKTTICSNLRNNITKTIAENKAGAEKVSRANFYIANSASVMTQAEYDSVVNVLSNNTEKNIIHKVTIEVFEPGSVAAGFPADKLITTINAGAQQ